MWALWRRAVERAGGAEGLARGLAKLILALKWQAKGWQGLREPFIFDFPPDLKLPYGSREELLGKVRRSESFQTATVLCDPLAAQFGPSMLGERSFQEAFQEGNCFSQLGASSVQRGTVPYECWQALPAWMRCSMVVVSTGMGGSGVAFHKHGTAWLALQQGRKRWWLYPPGGPPGAAYDTLALCPAQRLPEAVATLPPALRPLELLQEPGSVVFVPALWWHATYDEEATLAVGSQLSMAELDVLRCQDQYPDSGFAQYHAACELHKTQEEKAKGLFEVALEREPLNFYFATNQVLFYLNMVFHPKLTLQIISRLLDKITERLDPKRQMIVQRFFIPTVCNFVEWHLPHDGLLKYAGEALRCACTSLLGLLQPVLPGGEAFRLGSALPWPMLGRLEYVSLCFHCGATALGKPGEPGSVRAHRFFCLSCTQERVRARCLCGSVGTGQLGLLEGRAQWFCPGCWSKPGSKTPNQRPVRWEIVD